jgi:hypothetical protein
MADMVMFARILFRVVALIVKIGSVDGQVLFNSPVERDFAVEEKYRAMVKRVSRAVSSII